MKAFSAEIEPPRVSSHRCEPQPNPGVGSKAASVCSIAERAILACMDADRPRVADANGQPQ